MKKVQILALLFSLALLKPMALLAQNDRPNSVADIGHVALYVSKQTGQFSTKQGEKTITTDKYEEGTVNITVEGPMKWQLNPMDNSIGPNQTKTWTGKIWPDVANAPAAGTSKQVKLKGNYNVKYSRPVGVGEGGNVISTYRCAEEGTNDGCDFHGAGGGMHEIVNKIGTEETEVTIYSIKVEVPAEMTCSLGVAKLTCTTFPAAGEVTWQTPFGVFNGQDVEVNIPPGVANFNVVATYTVEGVSYSDAGVVTVGTMTAFDLAPCSNANVATVAVSNFGFNGACQPPVLLVPGALTIPQWTNTAVVGVTATSNGVVLTDNITMVNENRYSASASISFDFSGIEDLMDFIDDIADNPASPCEKEGSLIPTINFSRSEGKLCCGTLKDMTKIEGGASWAPGIKCSWPIYGVPYIATLDAVVSAGVNFSVSVDKHTTCAADSICANVSLTASIGGGLGFTLAGGVIEADLQLVVDGIGITGQCCFYPSPGYIKGNINVGALKVVGTATTVWVIEHSVEYTIFEGFPVADFQFNL